jgi:hypothetical protein
MDDIYINDFHKESQLRLRDALRKQKRLSPQEVHEMLLKHKELTRGTCVKKNMQNTTEKNNKAD